MAASGIVSPPPQLVIGEEMVAGQQERYSGKGVHEGDDQSTINTTGSTGSLSSSDETSSSLLSSSGSSGGSNNAIMGLDLADEGTSDGDRRALSCHGRVFEAPGLISAAAAAAELARSVRQQHHLQPPDGATVLSAQGELCDPYAINTPVTTPGATSSCASSSPPAGISLQHSRSFNGVDTEPQDMEQYASYQTRGGVHLAGMPMGIRAAHPGAPAGAPGLPRKKPYDDPGYYSSADAGGVLNSAVGSSAEELSERMSSMSLQARQQQLRMSQHQREQAGAYRAAHNQTGVGMHEGSHGQTIMSDMSSPSSSSSSGFNLPPPAAPMPSPTSAMPPRQQMGLQPPAAAAGSYMHGHGRHSPAASEHFRSSDENLHEMGEMGTGDKVFTASTDSSVSLGLGMGATQFMANYHGVETSNQYHSNPYPYNMQAPPPQEGMRPRSLSEGSLFYGPQDDGTGSQGVFPPSLGPRFQGYKPAMGGGIPPGQAQQMVQWITQFVRQKGGVITAANLGSALARLHPDFYSLIKASHGGLTAFLADYPERFSFANDPPFNHVFLSREVAGHPSPSHASSSASPAGLSLHHPSAYSLGHGPPRLIKPMPTSTGLPLTGLPIRTRSMSDPRLSPQPISALVGGVPSQIGLMQGQPYIYGGPGNFKLSSSPTADVVSGGGAFSQSSQGSPGASSSLGSVPPNWPPLDYHLESEVVRATSEILCNAASYALKAVELANTLRARLGTKVLAKVREKYGGLLFMLERHPHLFRVDRIPKNDCVTLLPKGLLLVTHPGAPVPAPSPSSFTGGHQQQQSGSVNMGMSGAGGPSPPLVSAYAHTIQQLQQQVAMAREKEAQAKQVAALHHQQQRHGLGSHGSSSTPSGHLQAENMSGGPNLHQRRMGVGISPLVTQTADLKARLSAQHQAAGQQQFSQGPPSGPPSLQGPSLSGGLSLVPETASLQRRHSWSSFISANSPTEEMESIDQAIGPPQGQRSLSVTNFYGAPAPPLFHQQQHSQSASSEHQISLGLYSGFGITVDGSMDTPGPGAALSPESDEPVGPGTSHNSQSTAQQLGSHGQIEKQSSAAAPQPPESRRQGTPSPQTGSPVQTAEREQPLESDNNSGTDADDKGDDDDDDDDDDAASGGSLSPGSEGVGGESNNVGSAGDPMPPQMNMWGGKGGNGEDRSGGLTGLTLRGWEVDGSMEDLLSQQQGKTRPMELGIPGLMPPTSTSGDGSSSTSSSLGATRSHSSGSLSSLYGASPPGQSSSSSSTNRQPVTLGLGLSGVSMCPVLQILTNNHFVPTQAWPAEPLRDSTYVNLIVEELRNVGGTTTVSKLRGLLKHKLASKETIKSVPLKALLQAYRTVFTLHRNHVTLNGNLRL